MTGSTIPLSRKTPPMEALLVHELPRGKEWRYEPKWDGFRCLAFRQDATIDLVSKSGKPLNRYFPDIVALLASIKATHFVLDGELVIEKDSGYSFADLQLRLHPASSRIAQLVEEAHATYVVFDLLVDDKGASLVGKTFAQRREKLEAFYGKYLRHDFLELSPQTASVKTACNWLDSYKKQIDGIVAKNSADIYHPGERAMQKFKPLKTADCVVGGFRYGTNSKIVGSLLLGLYDDAGRLNHVGYTSSLKDIDEAALTKKLEKLVAAPGFTGNAPGGPSRWSTARSGDWRPLKPELVVEVKYDHVSDERFRHGTKFLRWRPDKAPRQCTMRQLGR